MLHGLHGLQCKSTPVFPVKAYHVSDALPKVPFAGRDPENRGALR